MGENTWKVYSLKGINTQHRHTAHTIQHQKYKKPN